MAAKERRRQSSQVQNVTTGSNIRIEAVKSTRKPKQSRPQVVVSVAQDISPVNNFLDFLREHAVVGLIIGFVIGGQVQALVKQLVASFLDPITHLLFGTALSQRTFTLHFRDRAAEFGWGALIYALVIFMFVIVTMYVIIKVLNLDKLEKKEKESVGK